jgi:hypothetical protein
MILCIGLLLAPSIPVSSSALRAIPARGTEPGRRLIAVTSARPSGPVFPAGPVADATSDFAELVTRANIAVLRRAWNERYHRLQRHKIALSSDPLRLRDVVKKMKWEALQ